MKEKIRSTKAVSTGIYVRVSTEDQAQEGFSVRAQTEKLKTYALLKGWDIYDIYADEGISGKNIVDRPAMNRLIDDVENGSVNNVLVFKVDRLTRSTRNLIELVDLFEDNKCTFNSLTESIDTETPSGRMFLKIIGIFAEFERENFSIRTRLGLERKVKEGYTIASRSMSYGYGREKGQKIQKIIPHEAQIVREIFSMYVNENKSMGSIARTLNDRKIPTKENATWNTSRIKDTLTNPTYIGKVRYSGIEKSKYFEADGHHEPILDDELFNLAQEKIKNMPKFSKTKRPKAKNYFCGVLVCGECGAKFTTHHNSYKLAGSDEKQYKSSYRCNNKIVSKGANACTAPEISHPKMEKAFVEYINRINDITEKADDISIENDKNKEARELLEYIDICGKKLIDFQKKKDKIIEQYLEGDIEFEDYKKMVKLMNEKSQLQEDEIQIAKSKIPNTEKNPAILQDDIILNIKENWESLNNNEKMMFLHRFTKKVVITVEKERRNSNIVKIEDLEFNLSNEFSLEQWDKMLRHKDINIMKILKSVAGKQDGGTMYIKRVSKKKRYKHMR